MGLLDELNEQQRAAVEYTDGPALVIAGAGSGKTRVLTYRIANLLSKGVPAYRIMALTFTNKAAKEMKRRIAALVGEELAANLWMDTFHSVFSKILRFEAEKLGYTSNYTIYDAQDSRNLVKSVIKDLKLDDKVYKANDVMGRISMAKNNLFTAETYATSAQIAAADAAAKKPRIAEIFRFYQLRCRQSDTMDFDDLLLQTNILFHRFPEVLEKYQDKFAYILVDEYQDTNASQYHIIKALSAKHHNLCVVGDDAQSIYSFRGARIQNILEFRNDYPDYRLFKLERNYRSTTTIVDAANSVIHKNKGQIEKRIFSENETGDRVKVIGTLSDKEEGFRVVDELFRTANLDHCSYGNFAILYRTNAQSRILEEMLRKRNIPYQVYGGLSFYQRKEIKDLLAYFRLTVNPNDEEALRRIINYPRRGIGETTVDKMREAALARHEGIWTVLASLSPGTPLFNDSTVRKLSAFRQLIEKFGERAAAENAYDVAKHIAMATGMVEDLAADTTPEGVSRKENIQELLNAVKDFSETAYREGGDDKLPVFLQGVSLLTDQDKADSNDGNRVVLMTIHAAKGLEFPNVFVTGVEEGLFPGLQSLSNPDAMEEERRLFYVALTRAEKRVFISYAKSRYRNGTVVQTVPSRFIADIDPHYLTGDLRSLSGLDSGHETDFRNAAHGAFRSDAPGFFRRQPSASAASVQRPSVSRPSSRITTLPQVDTSKMREVTMEAVAVGMVLFHPVFGKGKVLALDGLGINKKAVVAFEKAGNKTLLLKYAKVYQE